MNDTYILAVIQEHSLGIKLGKWWQVLLVLIALIGIVWVIAKVSQKKQS
jgi:hypothetical protein